VSLSKSGSRVTVQNHRLGATRSRRCIVERTSPRCFSRIGRAREIETCDLTPVTCDLLFSEMHRRVVDDVQGSCYYQKVPRVKSGLPVYGGLIGWAFCAGIRLRENLG